MRDRQVYWSRKNKKIVAECKVRNSTIYLFTLPDVETVAKSCLFTKEKTSRIMDKIRRANMKDNKKLGRPQKVRTTNITRTFENHD